MNELPQPTVCGCSSVLAVPAFLQKGRDIVSFYPFIKLLEQQKHWNTLPPPAGIGFSMFSQHPYQSYPSQPKERTTVKRYKLHISHYVISISGFAQNQPVWSGRQLKAHEGPTIELTIAFPQDPPKRFNIPFPVTREMLRKLVGRHGGILWHDEFKLLRDRIDEFAKDVADNHSWYRPYRPFPDGFEDCVAVAWPVTAKGSVGAADAEEYVKSWF